MFNKVLNQLYRLLYGEDFDYSVFDKRLRMQKGIYLLQELGVPVGEYRFSWYKHGPYSQSLLDDMHSVVQLSDVQFTGDVEESIECLKEALDVPVGVTYSVTDWAECLGSLRYLKENYFSSTTDDEQIISELKKRKSHLSDNTANKVALEKINLLFS